MSDYTGGRASTCCVMLVVAAPMVSVTSYIRLIIQLWSSENGRGGGRVAGVNLIFKNPRGQQHFHLNNTCHG